MAGWAGIFILLGLLTFSANERSRRIRKVNRNTALGGSDIPMQGSPMADAITHMVGIAGGIYIALVTTISFLRVNIPETFDIMGISLDPIAGIAFVVTILHPFILTLRDKLLQ
jgi:hypothetical protein